MTTTDQERWQRVKNRLRIEFGEDVFTSWFARMEFDAVEKEAVRLSVPTRFLRKWIQSHYSDRVLANWQAEEPDHHPAGIERPLGRDPAARAEAETSGTPSRRARARATARPQRRRNARQRAVHDGARSARRLAARPAPDVRDFHRRPLEHAGACRGQAGRDQPPRRPADVQPALHPRRRRARQNPPAAGDHLGRQQQRPQGPLSDGRKVHVRLRLGAEARRRRWPSRKRCAPSTCW